MGYVRTTWVDLGCERQPGVRTAFWVRVRTCLSRCGATGDVAAAERQLNAIERLLAFMPRSRGFRVLALTAASASTRPPNVRGASLLRSRKALSNPSVHRARSRGASVLRLTHAPAAALHARRSTPKGVSRRRSACLQPLCRVQLVGREYPSSPLTGHALCVMCMAPIVNHTVKRERRG